MRLDGDLVLYGSTTSPFVRKVHVSLLEKGLPHRFELVSSWSPTGGIERLNPLRKVPVLGLDDGICLADSRVIVQYLDLRSPQPALAPTDPLRRLEALRIEAIADGVAEAAALCVQEGWRAESARSAVWSSRQRSKVDAGLAALEDAIEPWLPDGAPLTLAPIATGAALAFTAFWMPDLAWRATSPRLAALLQRLDGYPSWQATKPYLPEGAKFPAL
jgi:glutathione S-transferase